MGSYEKPVITVDAGMAEGIYASSGSSNSTLNITDGKIVEWGNGNGQKTFIIDIAEANAEKTSITLQFNNAISGCWGGGASVNVSGQEAKLTWSTMPKGTIEITAQASSNINNLKITGYTVE